MVLVVEALYQEVSSSVVFLRFINRDKFSNRHFVVTFMVKLRLVYKIISGASGVRDQKKN